MNGDNLSHDLAALEDELRELRTSTPPQSLRRRVLEAIGRERLTHSPSSSPWWFAACTAAAAALWINLSLCLTRDHTASLRQPEPLPDLRAGEEEIKRIAPELAPYAQSYVLSMWSGQRLPPAGDLTGGNLRFEEIK